MHIKRFKYKKRGSNYDYDIKMVKQQLKIKEQY